MSTTVTFKKDTVCHLAGNEINVGDVAPVVTVVNSNPMLQDETVGGEGKVQLISAVPSLDTPTPRPAASTKRPPSSTVSK